MNCNGGALAPPFAFAGTRKGAATGNRGESASGPCTRFRLRGLAWTERYEIGEGG